MINRVFVAIIATLLSFNSATLSQVTTPLRAETPIVSVAPNISYSVYLYIGGVLQDVTSQSAYNEDHVFFQGHYVGDRSGSGGMTIVNGSQVVGYLYTMALPDGG